VIRAIRARFDATNGWNRRLHKKIFIAVSRRLTRVSARREHAKEAVLMRVAAFMSQLK